MRCLDKQEMFALEALIDSCGLSPVLMALSEICGEKAEHVAVNWQDTALAKDWATAGNRISNALPSVVARGL
jgi:hypothetical protein